MRRISLPKVIVIILFATNWFSCKNEVQKEGTFKDFRDRKTYKIVEIGNQIWMAENLAYRPKEGYFRAYFNDPRNVKIYGYLYNWHTALNVCPPGWRLPNDVDWDLLIQNLGGEEIAGGKMKSTGLQYWNFPNAMATNESGFSALPGGATSFFEHYFQEKGTSGNWWSKDDYRYRANCRTIDYHSGAIRLRYEFKQIGLSVRCIKY